MKQVCGDIEKQYGHLFRIIPQESLRKTTEGADIIVTTTPSRKPLVMNYMISPGTHINCIGADAVGKEELYPHILKRAKIVIDDWEQAAHSGEINVPLTTKTISKEDVWAEIGEIVAGLKPGRQSDEENNNFHIYWLGSSGCSHSQNCI